MERVGRGWAWLDLVLTGLLAVPITARLMLGLIYQLSNLNPPPGDSVRDLFVSLAGVLGVLWALTRIREPKWIWILMDIIGRTWVAALISLFVLNGGAPAALLLFVVTELAGALHQGFALYRSRS